MRHLDASDLATGRLIDWLQSERLAVRELAGTAVAYGAATDQSMGRRLNVAPLAHKRSGHG
jgi:hypothetical protein